MLKDYLVGRQNTVQMPASEMNDKLQAIAKAFSEEWLTSTASHPLQRLWQRDDALATCELLNFGYAIERLGMEDPAWLRGQVRTIMTGSEGQSAGAIFEILALNLFSRQFCRVEPAPESKPGFDGTLALNDGSRVLVSIKNHGMSSRERVFKDAAKAVDDEFQAQLRVHGLRDVEANIISSEYLDEGLFEKLKADIAKCLAELKAQKKGGVIDRPYRITFRGMADQYGILSAHEVSSCLRIISPFSANEQANFEDAIRKGCDNLYKHTSSDNDDDVCRMIILRLSNTASMSKCREWARWHFTNYPQDPIDVILLYQCAVTTSPKLDLSAITHHISQITGPNFHAWQVGKGGVPRKLPDMSFLVGLISYDQPKLMLSDGSDNKIDIENYYCYQRADAYLKVDIGDNTEVVLSNPVPGVLIHGVLERDGVPDKMMSIKTDREQALALLP
ncbi:MAG: hypothetical protein KF899_04240 [Parvibaculum sp.]|nr:hypothetical protein [Parvibaculum sp.]